MSSRPEDRRDPEPRGSDAPAGTPPPRPPASARSAGSPPPERSGRASGRWRPELALALVVLALGVLVIVGTLDVTAAGSTLGLGPRFFPLLVGGAMILIGIAYVIDVVRGGHGDPEESEDVDAEAPADWRSVLLVSGIFLAFVAILQPLGWIVSASLLFFALAWALGAEHRVRAAIIGVVLGVATYLLFVKGLGVTLPGGVIPL